jgi:ankyrin repeat protein
MRCSRIQNLVLWFAVAGTASVGALPTVTAEEPSKPLERLPILPIVKTLSQLSVSTADLPGNTLSWAAANQRPALAKWLLDLRVNPNVTDAEGMTPLFHAVAGGDWPLAGELLSAGANPNLTAPGGISPLMKASAAGHLETIDALLQQGADVDAADATGRRSLHYAIAARKPAVMERLLAANAQVDMETNGGMDAFAFAAETGDWKFMEPILERVSSRVWDAQGRGALKRALDAKDISRMRLVMSKHKGPVTPEGCKAPLLTYAVVSNNLELARQLLDAGADPNTTLPTPAEPRFLAFVSQKVLRHYLTDEPGMTTLAIAAGMGHTDMLKLLMQYGAERNRPTRSKHRLLPIYFASWGGHADCIQSLLDNAPPPEKMRIEINLSAQRATFYKNGIAAFRTDISSGQPETPTKTGRFVVTDKKVYHVSNLYDAKMPFFMRLSCGDFGMHEGELPGYPASHGCIRLPRESAKKLFKQVPIGTLVTISR